MKIPSNKLKLRKAERLQGKLLEPVIPLMFPVSGLYCNKLLDVAIVTGLDMGPVYKKEKRAVRLSTRPVAAVKGKDISELFASPDPEVRVTRLPASRSSSIGPEGCFSFFYFKVKVKETIT